MKNFLNSSFLFAFILYLATNITSAVAVAVNAGGQNIAISSSSESGDVSPIHVLRGLRASADDTTNETPTYDIDTYHVHARAISAVEAKLGRQLEDSTVAGFCNSTEFKNDLKDAIQSLTEVLGGTTGEIEIKELVGQIISFINKLLSDNFEAFRQASEDIDPVKAFKKLADKLTDATSKSRDTLLLGLESLTSALLKCVNSTSPGGTLSTALNGTAKFLSGLTGGAGEGIAIGTSQCNKRDPDSIDYWQPRITCTNSSPLLLSLVSCAALSFTSF